ncbi:hypothetical protein Axi01nite_72660 [Actinoplanes xinjiangensis]|nr:hypothetical protein Axi01nite_72660 [Actinoplanes xinjiangensis]
MRGRRVGQHQVGEAVELTDVADENLHRGSLRRPGPMEQREGASLRFECCQSTEGISREFVVPGMSCPFAWHQLSFMESAVVALNRFQDPLTEPSTDHVETR